MASAGRAVAGHTSLSIISQALLLEWSASVPSVGPQQRVLPMQLVFRLRRFHLRGERGARRGASTNSACAEIWCGREVIAQCAKTKHSLQKD